MVDVTDLMMDLDLANKWPAARRWLSENYGDHAYFSLQASEYDQNQEPNPPEFVERWALIPFSVLHINGDHYTTFYLQFNDPNDEMVFRLKWL
jgi:hypothetical protein